MQRSLCFLLFLGFSIVLNAQVHFPKKDTPMQLQKIIDGLKDNFSGMRGQPIGSSSQSQEFESTLCWPGAEKCFITQYSAVMETDRIHIGNASWQAFMPSLESFKDATKQYKQIFQQINNSTINYNGNRVLLKAAYVNPNEDVGFHTILFENDADKRVQIEVLISNMGMEWQVKIAVFETGKDK